MTAVAATPEEVEPDQDPTEVRTQELCRRLGRIKVSRIMSPSAVSVPQSFSVKEAKAVLRRHRVRAAPVVDGAGRILGIVTLAEINRLIAALTDPGPPGATRTETATF